MKKSFFILLLFMPVSLVLGQTTFNFILPDIGHHGYNTRMSNDLLYDPYNNNYYFVYVTLLSDYTPQVAVIAKMDSNLQVTDSIICQNNYCNMYLPIKCIFLTGDSNLIVSFDYTCPSYLTTKYLLKLTPDLDTLMEKVLTPDLIPHGVFNYMSMAATKDNGYIFAGQYHDTLANVNQFGFMKVDSNLEVEWFKTVGSQWGGVSPDCVVQTYDGGYLAGGISYQYDAYGDNYMVRVDSAGNFIWDWWWVTPGDRDSFDGIRKIILTRDSNYIALAPKGNADPTNEHYWDTRLVKFDLNRQIIWDVTYTEKLHNYAIPQPSDTITRYFASPMDMIELPDGDIVFTVQALFFLNRDVEEGSMAFKLNPDGGLIWRRRFKASRYNNGREDLYDITAMPDGGFTFWGTVAVNDTVTSISYPPYQHLWIIRTDSMGCDGYGSCDTVRLQYIDPLPDTLCKEDTVNVRAILTGTDYTKSFYVMAGLAWLSSYWKFYDGYVTGDYYNVFVGDTITIPFYLDTANFDWDSAGYFLYINAMDSATHYQEKQVFPVPVVHFLTCDTNAIEDVSLEQPYLSVYPNPANEKLTVAVTNDRLKFTGIYIYDIMGTRVKTIILKIKTKRFNVNVKDLPAGVYFVKVETGKGTVVRKFVKE